MQRVASTADRRPDTTRASWYSRAPSAALLRQPASGWSYGGGQVGLMGAVARAAIASGGEVIGVIPRFLEGKEIISSADPRVQLRVVDSMHERKAVYYELAHAFVALPGGLGTLEEIFETLARAHLGLLRGPIILLNDGGYYDDVVSLLDRAVVAGFAQCSQPRVDLSGSDGRARNRGPLFGRLTSDRGNALFRVLLLKVAHPLLQEIPIRDLTSFVADAFRQPSQNLVVGAAGCERLVERLVR